MVKSRGFDWKYLLAGFSVVLVALFALTAGTASAAVDINTADQKTLESLPGIGPALAQEIVKGRPYKSVDELSRVKGIGKAKLEKLKGLVTVGGASAAPAAGAAGSAATKASSAAAEAKKAPAEAKKVPAEAKKVPAEAKKAGRAAKETYTGMVNLNTATKEQIESLPGIGPKKAQAVIDGRPYQKIEDIMKVKGIKQGIFNKVKDRITVQ